MAGSSGVISVTALTTNGWCIILVLKTMALWWQWKIAPSAKSILEFKTGCKPRQTMLLPRKINCWGISRAQARCFWLFPFLTPGKPGWLLPLPLQMQGVCNIGCPWRRVRMGAGWEHTLSTAPAVAVSASPQVSGKNRTSKLDFLVLSYSLWFPQLFLCQEQEHHGFVLGQWNLIFCAFLRSRFLTPSSDKDLVSSLGTKIVWWADLS